MAVSILAPQDSPRRSLLHRQRRKVLHVDSDSSPIYGACGCFPRRRKAKNKVSRSVKFDSQPSLKKGGDVLTEPGTPKITDKRRGIRVSTNSALGEKSVVRKSSSKRSFYSCISTVQKRSPGSSLCCCHCPAHTVFIAETPLVPPPNVEPNSYEELLIHANALAGKWVTILERSGSLDAQMLHVGIGKMKRMVMNRMAIPLTAVVEENSTLLHCWITTPVGDKHTRSSLVGKTTFDVDSDLGSWTATTSMVDYRCAWFCTERPIRAMQMKRTNESFGTAFETRAIIPDKEEGKVLLYNITIYPHGEDDPRDCLNVDRIYRAVSN